MNLVLLGPPGAGKGTQAKLLQEELGLLHISTGDILREEMKNETILGVEVKKYVESGGLVPDEVVTRIIENKIKNTPEVSRGFMLDGFPRTEKQAQDLDDILDKMDKPLDYSLYFEVNLPVIIFRLTGRRVCRKCGALYHTTNMPSKQEGVCDVCGGELYQRPDDNEETIKKRMDVYTKNTAPVIDFYQKQGKLQKVDSNKSATEVNDYLMDFFKRGE